MKKMWEEDGNNSALESIHFVINKDEPTGVLKFLYDRCKYTDFNTEAHFPFEVDRMAHAALERAREHPCNLSFADAAMLRTDHYKFPFCVHLVSWENENVSNEALAAAYTACNKYMPRVTGKEALHLRVRVHLFHVLRLNKRLPCVGADRLQVGMRGAFGKLQGTCVRMAIGHILVQLAEADDLRMRFLCLDLEDKVKVKGEDLIQS